MGKYKNPVCRGSWALGNNCGKCERCIETRPAAQPDPKDQRIAELEQENQDRHDMITRLVDEGHQLRARVQELEAEGYKLPPQGFVRNLQDTIDRLRAELKEARAVITHLKRVCDERQASRMSAWKERDAARAECETLKAALAASDKHCEIVADQNEHLLARVSRLVAALEYYANSLTPPYNQADDGKRAREALAETDAGGKKGPDHD